ncbi:MAG: AAA family ATPase, partial [Synergistaceae bacterium]|nr:AAA family ATPase [Synergistaceae bacterium]
MIARLSIKNIGGIGGAELTFSGLADENHNFIVITGESGAGKSSVVRALEMLSGRRYQASFILAGEDSASVEADISLEPNQSCPEDGVIFASRQFSRAGRGSAYIQNKNQMQEQNQIKPIPLSSYAETMAKLLRIQSQFAQLELLDESRQLAMVDTSGGAELEKLLGEMKAAYQDAVREEKLLRSLTEKSREIEKKFENAENVIQIVNSCNPQTGLESELEGTRKNSAEKIAALTQGRSALDELTGGASGSGVMGQLERACMKICRSLPEETREDAEKAANEGMSNIQNMLRTAESHFSANELRRTTEEYESAEQRLGNLRKLKRMTGAEDEEAILKWSAEAGEAISWLQNSRAEISETESRSRAARREASRCAMQLRELRKNAAAKLEAGVNECLKELGMEDASLSVRFSELSRL